MRRFGFTAFLILALLVGAVGVVAYNLGVSAGATDAAVEAGAAVVLAPATISPLAAVFGLFFVLLLIGLAIRVFAGPRRHMGPGPWGKGRWGAYGAWDHETVPSQFRPMLDRWHQETHSAQAGPAASQGPAGRGTAPPQGAPTPPPGPAQPPR